MQKVIITCGPSYEPVDQVRRLTNFSTGELGVMLSNRLTRDGVDVICLKGEAATTPLQTDANIEVIHFTTNAHLIELLSRICDRDHVAAFFHAAALCDFKIKSITNAKGTNLAREAKLSSRRGELLLELEPAEKVISKLRALFPNARIAGWKYELSGTRKEALAKGHAQIIENQTDLCIVNGAAYGDGFGVVEKQSEQPLHHAADKSSLCDFLAQWLNQPLIGN